MPIVALLAVVLAVGFALASFTGILPKGGSASNANLSSPRNFPPIAGIGCDETVEDASSARAMLVIRVSGQRQTIPGGIGKRTGCRYGAYTSDSTGVIHLDVAAGRSFTLGQFFDIWLEPLDETRIGGHVGSAGEAVFAFVDREPWAGDPRAIPLDDKTIVELQLGAKSEEPLNVQLPPE